MPVHADLVGQALAIFGSFDRARSVAGLPSPSLEHDTDVIIGALRSLARSGVRLDVQTLSTMGESGLVAACVDTFGSVAAGVARAGLGGPPPERRPAPTYSSGGGGGGGGGGYGHGGGHQQGFAQPPISTDGQVPTALALEELQKTALQLGRVPAARDLPPDVARRLTTDFGSVRFAYLALRVHAEGEGGTQTAEGAAQAASEPVANVSQDAFAATARILDSVGVNRRNIEAQRDTTVAPRLAPEPPRPPDEPFEVTEDELDELWAKVEEEIDAAAAAATATLRRALGDALDHFVGEVTEIARHQTLQALVPVPRAPGAGDPAGRDEDDDYPHGNGADGPDDEDAVGLQPGADEEA